MENADSFVDEMLLPEYNQWKLYINYSYLNEYVEDNVEAKTGGEERGCAAKIEAALQMYSLFSFVKYPAADGKCVPRRHYGKRKGKCNSLYD